MSQASAPAMSREQMVAIVTAAAAHGNALVWTGEGAPPLQPPQTVGLSYLSRNVSWASRIDVFGLDCKRVFVGDPILAVRLGGAWTFVASFDYEGPALQLVARSRKLSALTLNYWCGSETTELSHNFGSALSYRTGGVEVATPWHKLGPTEAGKFRITFDRAVPVEVRGDRLAVALAALAKLRAGVSL